jgi:hypothetical protein
VNASDIGERILGDVIVPAGRHLDPAGHVSGDLIVARSAPVVLRRSVAGTLIVYGGRIEIVGPVGAKASFGK